MSHFYLDLPDIYIVIYVTYFYLDLPDIYIVIYVTYFYLDLPDIYIVIYITYFYLYLPDFALALITMAIGLVIKFSIFNFKIVLNYIFPPVTYVMGFFLIASRDILRE